MDKSKFGMLDDANLFLGNVTGYADKAFENLEGAAQSGVDIACAEVSYQISKAVDACRVQMIKKLHEVVAGQFAVVGKFAKLANMSITDPLALLSPVLEIVDILCAPYYEALTIITELTPKVMELSSNIQKIASYKPPALSVAPSPGVFNIQVGSISMGEIISGVPTPLNLQKPDYEKIKENAKKTAEQKFQDATAYRADAGNSTPINPNTVTYSNPAGLPLEEKKEAPVEPQSEISDAYMSKLRHLEQLISKDANTTSLERKSLDARLGLLERNFYGCSPIWRSGTYTEYKDVKFTDYEARIDLLEEAYKKRREDEKEWAERVEKMKNPSKEDIEAQEEYEEMMRDLGW